ncbi:MAG: hypothetical protein HY706_19030 [Candidatus Hydrogenedentes bacterium]|nr:hypothetical protein [Candidatus Hydrogenedentota bacterium]
MPWTGFLATISDSAEPEWSFIFPGSSSLPWIGVDGLRSARCTREENDVSLFFWKNIVLTDHGKPLSSAFGKGGLHFFDLNCYWDVKNPEFQFSEKSFDEWKALGQDRHSIIADPLFENAEVRDFRLKLGFQPIDPAQPGLYGPEEWVTRPRNNPQAPK